MNQTREVDLIEAAVQLQVSWHTVHRFVLTGRLKGERRDGRWKVDAADLERLVTERTTASGHNQFPKDG